MTTTIARFTGDFTEVPFSAGGASSSLVPSDYPVSIDGHPYMLDLRHEGQPTNAWFREESLPLLRDQADSSKLPGEQSISPAGYWRRSGESWHEGAGQSYVDRGESSDFRFNTSKGVDPWTRWRLSLLPATSRTETLASTSNGPSMVSTGSDVYATAGGTSLRYSADGTTWATVTGTPGAGATCAGLATSGGVVYSAWGTSGVYATTAGATTAAALATGTASIIGYAKGRLLTGDGPNLRNYVSGAALPAAFYAHTDSSWEWRAFCGGNSFIYAGGAANGRSAIYRIAIQPDATALTVPVQACELPTGETVRSLAAYMGLVIIGTDKGVRLALAAESGDLTFGALIPTAAAVRALEPSGQYVWFGWTNYDATSTGLGRMDLTVVSDALAPAYATDLMATAQGTVQAVATVDSKRIFAVAGDGIYLEQATPVTSGTLSTGQITYGISDEKTALFCDLKHEQLPTGGAIAVAISVDGGAATSIGSSSGVGSTTPSSPLAVGQKRGETFELTVTLTAASSTSPALGRWTLRAYPAPRTSVEWTLPLVFSAVLRTRTEAEVFFNPAIEHDYLTSIAQTRQVVSLQIEDVAYSAIVTDYVWLPDQHDPASGGYEGTFVIKLRET